MSTPVKKTRLHGWHVNHGANMAIFGAYDMPLWYPSGAKEEHLVVLTRAGIFDTSHMSVVTVKGSGARDLLQVCFSKNLAACVGKDQKPLTPGRSVYGVFLNEAGEVIDDAIVFQIDDALFMVVVNAGMGGGRQRPPAGLCRQPQGGGRRSQRSGRQARCAGTSGGPDHQPHRQETARGVRAAALFLVQGSFRCRPPDI